MDLIQILYNKRLVINSLKKPYLQLVQSGFEKKLSGFNFARDYILYDPANPEIAIKRTKNILLNYWNKLVDKQLSEQRKINLQKYRIEMKQKEKEEKQLIVGLGILAGIVALRLIYGND